MRLRNVWMCALGIALVASVACGGGQSTANKSAEPSAPAGTPAGQKVDTATAGDVRSEEHTSELQSRENLVCGLLPEKKNPVPAAHGQHAGRVEPLAEPDPAH